MLLFLLLDRMVKVVSCCLCGQMKYDTKEKAKKWVTAG